MIEHLYPHMLQEYYVARIRKAMAARDRRLAKVRTRADVIRLKVQARKRLAESFGAFPEKTPINARVTGSFDREAYRVEKVIFESRPGLPVTANLYIPKSGKGPFPCVLGACGHSGNGKAEAKYQAFCQGLATKEYLVLIYDPLSQGERLQYPVEEGAAHPKGCCQEHNMMGNQMGLLGEFFGKWRVWDGIRALDYLLSRPEADPRRVGVTGNSGGGTLTTYLNAFDDRFTMAAPGCFVTTYLCNAENELPADAEQIPPNIIKLGLDMADFFIAQIPRPVLLLGQNNDYFDRRGLTKTYEDLKRLYKIMGAGENIQLSIGPTDHGYSEHNREAMYAFFNRHAGVRAEKKECAIVAEPDEQLQATPEGQVHKMGVKRVFDLTKVMAAEVEKERRPVSASKLKKILPDFLALPDRDGPPHYRVLRQRGADAKPYTRHSGFAVETEPGIQAILHVFSKDAGYFHFPKRKDALLYVPHISSQQDVIDGHAPGDEELLFAVDVRGIGQTTALTCANSEFFAPYGTDYFYASQAAMLGEPYLGRRVHDLLATLDLMQSEGYRRVHLMGRGLGAIFAALAACLHPVVKQVTLKNCLQSYYELTQVPVQSWPFSVMPHGLLESFDLPDCYRALGKKSLRILDPWNSQMAISD
ncbi:MAG: acetylxylan esterase [Planctomycetota bacterium]